MKHYQLALGSCQNALEISLKLCEEYLGTADQSYCNIGITHHKMEDYKSALESHQKALETR